MDYSVGSLSDLITGSNTTNKKKVIKKQILKNAEIDKTEGGKQGGDNVSFTPRKKYIPKNIIRMKSIGENRNKNEGTIKLAGKKRKFPQAPVEDTVEPKRNKNNENAERRVSLKEKTNNKVPKPEEDPELLSRTVFVGNLPITLDTKRIRKVFKKFGDIDTVRIRGIPVANPKISKKVALIKKEFHPDRKSVFAFVRFQERESAIKAADANGMVYEDHHLRIHLCDIKDKPDENKAIFVGNLSFYAEENDLWKTFEDCGSISSVRIVRDGRTGIGKGFGYVNFENSDAVTLALEMENVKIKDRELRISICNINAAKKNVKKNKKAKKIMTPGKPKSPKKEKQLEGENEHEKNDVANKQVSHTFGNKPFQGTKFIQKKNKTFNKGVLQKKKKSRQIAPKPIGS